MLDCTITETKDIEPVIYEWGAVKWVANSDLDPGCEQSFGLVHILPGKFNPEHWHTGAEELIYMLQGESVCAGRRSAYDDQTGSDNGYSKRDEA